MNTNNELKRQLERIKNELTETHGNGTLWEYLSEIVEEIDNYFENLYECMKAR